MRRTPIKIKEVQMCNMLRHSKDWITITKVSIYLYSKLGGLFNFRILSCQILSSGLIVGRIEKSKNCNVGKKCNKGNKGNVTLFMFFRKLTTGNVCKNCKLCKIGFK